LIGQATDNFVSWTIAIYAKAKIGLRRSNFREDLPSCKILQAIDNRAVVERIQAVIITNRSLFESLPEKGNKPLEVRPFYFQPDAVEMFGLH